MIKLRTFYIFKINKSLSPIYEQKSTSIFKLLNRINEMDDSEYDLAKRIYNKITLSINKSLLDNYILMNHMNDIYYKKTNNIHTLSSAYEESKLTIFNTFLKIETTNNISSFFKDLFEINNNLFCIDFENKDYFYLDEFRVKLLV